MLKIGPNSSNYAKHNVVCRYSMARASRSLARRGNRSEVYKLTERLDKYSSFFFTLSDILGTDSSFQSSYFLKDTSFPLADQLRSDSLFFIII